MVASRTPFGVLYLLVILQPGVAWRHALPTRHNLGFSSQAYTTTRSRRFSWACPIGSTSFCHQSHSQLPHHPMRSALSTNTMKTDAYYGPQCQWNYGPQCQWKNNRRVSVVQQGHRHNTAIFQAASSSSSSSDEEPTSSSSSKKDDDVSKRWFGRVKSYFLPEKKGDELTFKQRLAKMGVATVLSYGMISNLSYAILIALAWYAFSVQTKLSPLAPGQWKGFLGVYAGFWVFNNVIRPLRVGLSIAIAPSLDKLVLFFQNRLKISKPLAVTVTVLFVNVIGTTVLMCGGIALAALLAGVPIFPPK